MVKSLRPQMICVSRRNGFTLWRRVLRVLGTRTRSISVGAKAGFLGV